jgi:cell division transport system ATP-binding protein
VIELFGVTKTYAGEASALTGVSLSVRKGEFVFLTGASGAGKTTLLRLLFAAERPTEGQILVNGRNLSRLSPRHVAAFRREVGVVFQDFKLLPARTVFDNVALPLEVAGVPPKELRRKVAHVLRAVSLSHRMFAFPPGLSGGEQQRVAIARAVVGDPVVLLADEPTGNLDPDLALEIMALLFDIHARGTTVLVATHDRTLIGRFHHRVLTLDRGRLTDTPAAVERARHARARAVPAAGRTLA